MAFVRDHPKGKCPRDPRAPPALHSLRSGLSAAKDTMGQAPRKLLPLNCLSGISNSSRGADSWDFSGWGMKCPFTADPGNVGVHCWGSEAEPSRPIPSVWDEVCKAFTQRGADPDLALGALSQEKSLLENSQWLLCVRSEE